MRIAIIDIGYIKLDYKDPYSMVLGGSETWLVQIAKEFSNNHSIDVFCNIEQKCTINDNLTFIPKQEFFSVNDCYDFIILNRFFKQNNINYIQYIYLHKLAKHVFLQMHDKSFTLNNVYIDKVLDAEFEFLNSKFVTIVTLNPWHRENLFLQYPSLLYKDACECIPNGLDLSLFPENIHTKRDNRILWSSSTDRGLNILIDDVYPIVKAEIPDFGIDYCGYEGSVVETNGKDVKYLGKLTKQELYCEQSKHKVWFYPDVCAETFCITLIENILCGARVVSPLKYGMYYTFGYSDQERMKYSFNGDSYKLAVEEAAKKIITILKNKNDNSDSELYKKVIDKIHTEYVWRYPVERYIQAAKKYTREFYKKKILILSMSCNDNYFRTLLSVVKDTWAKPLIENKYPDIVWFGYTSCDKKHPNPIIDWTDHMIYVDCPDDLNHTYLKTQLAYNMIKDNFIDFDYVLRTNTSVFINVENLIKRTNYVRDNEIIGECNSWYIYTPATKSSRFMWNIIPGMFLFASKRNFEAMLSGDNDNEVVEMPVPDDVIIGKKIFNEHKCGNVLVTHPNDIFLNSSTLPNSIGIAKYKPFEKNDDIYDKLKKIYVNESFLNSEISKSVFEPELINSLVVMQVRSLYQGKERRENGHEFEHFYELLDALD